MQDAPKRLRYDEAADTLVAAPACGSISRSDVEQLLGEFRTSISSQTTNIVDTATKHLESAYREEVCTLLRGYDKKSTERIVLLENKTREIEQTQRKQAADLNSLQGQVADLKKKMAIVESTTPDRSALQTEEFDREPDPTIICISLADAAAKAAVDAATLQLMDSCCISRDDYEITGLPIAKDFTALMHGTEGLGARRVRKASGSLRRRDGSWATINVKTPDDHVTRAYFNRDKSTKQKRTEISTRNLERVIKAQLPNHQVQSRRYMFESKEGQVSVDGMPMAKVKIDYDAAPTILWNNLVVDKLTLDKQAVATAFNETSGTKANIQLSV